MDPKYTYLLLNIGSVFFPFVLSFDKKVAYWKKWWSIFPGIIIMALIFIGWDEYFTRAGVWDFNEEYITGIYLGSLPLEEWLFFITIPYSCIFIYECLKAYFSDWLQNVGIYLWGITLLGLAATALLFHDRIYTVVTFTGAALFLVILQLVFGTRFWGRFFMMWFIHLIPMAIVNGVLTAKPVVIYNDAENLAIRLGTIPIEDFYYSMLMLLIVLLVHEYLQAKKVKSLAV